jgi:hypothetical protein
VYAGVIQFLALDSLRFGLALSCIQVYLALRFGLQRFVLEFLIWGLYCLCLLIVKNLITGCCHAIGSLGPS